ncbi:protein EFR3 homolog B-like isoform X1 [Mytilus trossulus]|uniref:protein EFR3 homolog B-like isoform X1 n=1 Tax=Mytilus trossulus TaxID=6551 RepID=UPI003003F6C5
MISVCFGCACLKPRYKRLVDNIFPLNPEDGLVKNNMDKLTYYAMSNSEKLDRIGAYLEQKLGRDLQRRRIGNVFISMDALDQLLVACHSHSLNLFVESFLKMVQKLLESDDPDLQVLATQSFVKFANIEEDNPSYHRRYDFFVSKFSAMCHCGKDNENIKTKIRNAGLRGLQGVVRKTVSDDLQVNIWESIHMDKMVPSLLFNMHNPNFMSVDLESPKDEEHPVYLSEVVFRDLVCRASYGNIKSVLKPALIHYDNHKLWVPSDFVVKCFKIIMYSVQQQYGYIVIQTLMEHLDKHTRSEPQIKNSIIDVLYESVLIAAGGSIGPSVLDVINTLLRHLRLSIETNDETKEQFEDNIINTIGEFAKNLPDYQKIEIMMFIMGKFPQFSSEELGEAVDTRMQTMLLKTLLKVATKYKTVEMQKTFPVEFLIPLLRISLLPDSTMRATVQDILHKLIDRHDNTEKLKHITIPKDVGDLDLVVEKNSRHDSLFMKKNGLQFYWHILENVQMTTNKVNNFESLYCTMCLLCVEIGCDEMVIELLRLGLDLQQLAMTNSSLPLTHKCAVHGMVAAYLNLASQLLCEQPVCQYISEIIEMRRKEAPHYLPEFAFNRANRPNSYPSSDTMRDEWLFDQVMLQELLVECGQDASRLNVSLAQKPYSAMDVGTSGSASDIGSIQLEVESTETSPMMSRKSVKEEITVESLKKMLAEDSREKKEEEEKRRLEIVHTFRTAPFEEIVARSEAKSNHFRNKLSEILDMVSKPPESPERNRKAFSDNVVPVYDMQFPELFVY